MKLTKLLNKLNFILFFVRSKSNTKIIHKSVSIEVIRSLNKNSRLFNKLDYTKLKRFNKKNSLIILKDKNTFIGSGWVYFGKKNWKITEINKTISLQNYYLLYDFNIVNKYRNVGYYSDFLRLIKNYFSRNNLCIYTTLNNYYSLKGIKSSGFSLHKIISKFFVLKL